MIARMTHADKVARAARKAALAREALESAIREAHAEGMSLRLIASMAGMSHESVRRITS